MPDNATNATFPAGPLYDDCGELIKEKHKKDTKVIMLSMRSLQLYTIRLRFDRTITIRRPTLLCGRAAALRPN